MVCIKSNVIPNTRWEIKREILYTDVQKKHRALKHNPEIVKMNMILSQIIILLYFATI